LPRGGAHLASLRGSTRPRGFRLLARRQCSLHRQSANRFGSFRLRRQLVGTILARGGGRWRTRLRLSLGRLDDLIQQFRGGGRRLFFVAFGSLGFPSTSVICV